jgi:hypothetical protein
LLPQHEPPWDVSAQRLWSLSLKMCTTFSSYSVDSTGCILLFLFCILLFLFQNLLPL